MPVCRRCGTTSGPISHLPARLKNRFFVAPRETRAAIGFVLAPALGARMRTQPAMRQPTEIGRPTVCGRLSMTVLLKRAQTWALSDTAAEVLWSTSPGSTIRFTWISDTFTGRELAEKPVERGLIAACGHPSFIVPSVLRVTTAGTGPRYAPTHPGQTLVRIPDGLDGPPRRLDISRDYPILAIANHLH